MNFNNSKFPKARYWNPTPRCPECNSIKGYYHIEDETLFNDPSILYCENCNKKVNIEFNF